MFKKRRIRKSGERAQATVVSADERSHLTTNELRDYDFVLDVQPATGAPFQANVRDKFWITGLKPQVGDVLNVRFDPESHDVVFDLDGDPRYDVDALKAQTAETRAKTAQLRAQMPPKPEERP